MPVCSSYSIVYIIIFISAQPFNSVKHIIVHPTEWLLSLHLAFIHFVYFTLIIIYILLENNTEIMVYTQYLNSMCLKL